MRLGTRCDSLLEGRYRISAIRTLSGPEIAQLPDSLRDVTGFGGGTTADIAAPSHTSTISVVAGRRGSLVISEFHTGWWEVPPLGSYRFGAFVELYNNADTTVALDGKHLVHAYDYDFDSPSEPCDVNIPFRRDPSGVWAYAVYRFPGTPGGSSYQLAPGEAVIVATDAVDQRPFAPKAHDLSSAQFEISGSADVDNPAALNLTNLGPGQSLLGHGPLWSTAAVPMIADTFTYASLERGRTSYFNTELVRVPAALILDVAALVYDRSVPSQFARCDEIIHPAFDAAAADLVLYDDDQSIHRRVLVDPVTGPAILQRTRTSARDFERRARSPGQVP